MATFIIFPKDTAIKLFLIAYLSVIGHNLNAQYFGAAASIGLNASQIDGDGVTGYNRLGLEISMNSIITINAKTEIQAGLAYSERGSLESFGQYSAPEKLSIQLRYICVPIQFHFKDWLSDKGYYKIHYFGGVNYGRLFDVDVRPADKIIATDNYQLNDFSWTAGFQYFFTPNWGIGLQYTGSLNLLYNAREFDQIDLPSMRSYFLTLRLIYRIT